MEQVLLKITHDGRFGTKQGRQLLAQKCGQYIWNIEGNSYVEAALVPDDKVVIPRAEYEQLLALKEHTS